MDFAGLLRAAAARGLRPGEMWALTPAELMVVLGRSGGPAGMGRARLEELAAAYPDGERADG